MVRLQDGNPSLSNQKRRTIMKLVTTCLLTTLCFAGLSACSTPSQATRLVDVTVIDRLTGERLPTYRHAGNTWIAGTPGHEYSVELRSLQSARLLSVMSVDGINVLSGESAGSQQSGYVLSPYQSASISGWRKSMSDVAKFVFTPLSDSYAARTGRPANVGVIGVAVFRERYVPPAPVAPMVAPQAALSAAKAERASSSLADSAGTAARESESVTPQKKIGTGHGEREYAPTTYTAFERAGSQPDAVVTLYYDSRENLIAQGIIPQRRHDSPNPFPGNGFVPDPKG
jgi:hypothetical protein